MAVISECALITQLSQVELRSAVFIERPNIHNEIISNRRFDKIPELTVIEQIASRLEFMRFDRVEYQMLVEDWQLKNPGVVVKPASTKAAKSAPVIYDGFAAFRQEDWENVRTYPNHMGIYPSWDNYNSIRKCLMTPI